MPEEEILSTSTQFWSVMAPLLFLRQDVERGQAGAAGGEALAPGLLPQSGLIDKI